MPAENLKSSPMPKRLMPVLALIGLCWAVFVLNNLIMDGHLNQYGIRPRHLSSLPGILWSPFLHVSLRHLVANTIPLAILGAILCLRGRNEFGIVTVTGVILSGGLT